MAHLRQRQPRRAGRDRRQRRFRDPTRSSVSRSEVLRTRRALPLGFFQGSMDEVRVWDVARSQSQIRATMNDEVTGAPNLIGRWGLNQGAGADCNQLWNRGIECQPFPRGVADVGDRLRLRQPRHHSQWLDSVREDHARWPPPRKRHSGQRTSRSRHGSAARRQEWGSIPALVPAPSLRPCRSSQRDARTWRTSDQGHQLLPRDRHRHEQDRRGLRGHVQRHQLPEQRDHRNDNDPSTTPGITPQPPMTGRRSAST